MRLVQVVPVYASYAMFLRELARAAVTAGHPTAVVCGGIPSDVHLEDTAGVQLLPLDLPRGGDPRGHWLAARRLRHLLEEWRADVVHGHFSAGIFSVALAVKRSDPWFSIGTFQGLAFPLVHGYRRHMMRIAEGFAAARLDRAEVLTADDLDALRRAAPSARAAVQPGYGFGCPDRFLDTPRLPADQRRDLRRALSISEEHRVLIFVGRLVAFKGFDLAVRTFWGLHERMPSVRLVVLGAPDPLHPSGLSAAEWQRYQSDPAIVRGGTQADVLPWLDLADLMLFPTEREGMPVCVMEALARGLPVVTTPVRGCRELIIDGRNGLLIPGRATAEWVPRLAEVVDRLGSATFSADLVLRERLRRSRWVAQTLSAYSQAVAQRHSMGAAGTDGDTKSLTRNPSALPSATELHRVDPVGTGKL